MNWNSLSSIEDLKRIDEISSDKPVVIFKHSTRCSVSATALNRLERKWSENEKLEPYILDLIANRDVSNEIASKFGVDHQSPQVLIIKDGKCIYDNSHFGISYDELVAYAETISA